MKFLDRYDAINPLSLSDSVKMIAPEHIVYGQICFHAFNFISILVTGGH